MSWVLRNIIHNGLVILLLGAICFSSCVQHEKRKERCSSMDLIDYFFPESICGKINQCSTVSLHFDKIQNQSYTEKIHYNFLSKDMLTIKRIKVSENKNEQYEYTYEVSPKKVVLKSLRHQSANRNWLDYDIQKNTFLACKSNKYRVLRFTIPSNEMPTSITNQISHILIDSTQYLNAPSSMLMNFGKTIIKNNHGNFQSNFTELFIKGYGQVEYIETQDQDTIQHNILHSIRKIGE